MSEYDNEISRGLCQRCKGNCLVVERVYDPRTGTYRGAYDTCPSCYGKGFMTDFSIAAARHRQGIGPCPHGNDCCATSTSHG